MGAARIGRALAAVAVLVVGIWLLEVLDLVTGLRLDSYGITPRRISELPDIFTAPFLHAGFGHVMANTVPLALLGVFTALRGLARLAAVTLTVVVVGGLGVWLTAPSYTITLGASILVFGYFGYLITCGFIEREAGDIAIAAVVAAIYGTMIFGVLPLYPGVSWQGHLFGLAGGVLAGWLLSRRGPASKQSPQRRSGQGYGYRP